MSNFKSMGVIFLATILLAGCGTASLLSDQSQSIKSGQLDISTAPSLIRHGAEVDLFYYSPDNSLIRRHADGAEQVLGKGNEQEFRSSYVVTHSDGMGIYALWRPKLIKDLDGLGGPGDKLIYLRASPDGGKTFGATKRLNQQGGAFKPFIASSGKGDVYVIWTDERTSSAAYDIYLNVSHDRGGNWKKEDIKITGSESSMSLNPSIVADGDHVYVSWMTYAPENKQFKIFVRASNDRGETWGVPVEAHRSPIQPNSPILIKTQNRLLMCWGDRDAVRCKYSEDKSRAWDGNVLIDDSEGATGLYLETDRQGRAQMLIFKKPADGNAKVNIFHAYSEDGKSFSKPYRLSGGAPYQSSAIAPAFAFGDSGSMLIAWTDMQYLRPVVVVNYSADGGKKWLDKNIVVAGNNKMFNVAPSIATLPGEKYKLAWLETPNRSSPTTNIVMGEYRPGFSGIAMPEPDVARLKARVDKFWELREQEKWDQVYDFMDPFYRETNSKSSYIKSQGAVKYYEHSLVGEPGIANIKGNVRVKYVSEVPELMLTGKNVSVPKQEVEISQEWIWVDGDWYIPYTNIFGGNALPD